jgi:hypothetical protein
MADDRRKLLTIHPSSIAVALKSLPMEGSARFIADPRKGVRNAANADTSKTDFLKDWSSE